MREIKFRAWNKPTKRMHYWPSLQTMLESSDGTYHDKRNFLAEHNEFMQFTSLCDKNGVGQEVYEGDIIDSDGEIKGNIYEMDAGETDLVIEGLGTSAWSKTEKAGLERGLKYSE